MNHNHFGDFGNVDFAVDSFVIHFVIHFCDSVCDSLFRLSALRHVKKRQGQS